jgi:hypothetical protein
MNLAGKFYVNISKRATRASWSMPFASRPVWRHSNKTTAHGQQEEAI